MKISTILDHIDSGHKALPGIERSHAWNRAHVRGLFEPSPMVAGSRFAGLAHFRR